VSVNCSNNYTRTAERNRRLPIDGRAPNVPFKFGFCFQQNFFAFSVIRRPDSGRGRFRGRHPSLIIVVAAWRRGAALVTLARMITNVALLGSIPVFGDAFHVVWKANRRNYREKYPY
jgi:hypothetical protein